MMLLRNVLVDFQTNITNPKRATLVHHLYGSVWYIRFLIDKDRYMHHTVRFRMMWFIA